jgi:hypothetical protein
MAFTRFHLLLKEAVEEEVNKVKADLVAGASKDYSQYQFSVGQVFGMELCLKLCENIERESDERSHST